VQKLRVLSDANPSGLGSMIFSSGPIAAIMLAGKTGAGKSSLIKLLGGRDAEGNEPVSDGGLESCTYCPLQS
jgi:ABC-type transport system involved in cytochrome bd biosynthesis fused ATPase/permease subunit